MCGIIGVLGKENSCELVKTGLGVLKNRGKDGFGLYCDGKLIYSKSLEGLKDLKGENCLGHCLHAVVGDVKQPFEGFVANCEIYNWKELNEKFGLKAKNDAEVLFKLLNKFSIKKVLELLDGVYAFGYFKGCRLYLARDILGVKPIWYCKEGFASEKKALEKLGFKDIKELNPREILVYDRKIKFIKRKFFELKDSGKSLEVLKKGVEERLEKSIEKRIPNQKFGLLFSGGIDSTLLAYYFKKFKKDFVCYTAGFEDKGKEAEDLEYAKKVAKDLGLKLKVKILKLEDVEKYLEKVVPLIEDNNVVKVGVGLTFFVACEMAKKDGVKVIFSGLGSEEVFAGYERHKNSYDINKECLAGLRKMYERDLYRDDVVTMYNGLELRVPFLDLELVKYCLKIPGKFKIGEHDKEIIRKVGLDLGVKEEFVFRKKKAAQYGSKFHKALSKLAKKNGFKLISEYLKGFYFKENLKLGVLFSSGKDSAYAAYVMKKQNYEISCLMTVKSKNLDSFMFHTPNVSLVGLQSKAMGVPLIDVFSKGKKEEELKDLERLILKGVKEFKIDGVVVGALFSSYQRDRVEKICDKLGLKMFCPLWHKDQEELMKELVKEGFEVVISSVAGDGFDESWLGRKLDDEMIKDLVGMNKKLGVNIGFEGGEAESLVLDCPLFKKKIKIIEFVKKMDSRFSGRLIVDKAELIRKV